MLASPAAPSLKLGLKPLVRDPRDLMFARYRTGAPLPKHPATFGHENLIKEWGMLANDEHGDCVLAGAAHETMLWCAMGGRPIPRFTDDCVLSDYAAITGFDPATGDNDNGTDMREAAKYRQKTGIVDADGNRHKIGAYIFLPRGDWESLQEAIWLFGAVGIGVILTQDAMDEFHQNFPWDTHWFMGPQIGGHYIPGIAERAMLQTVSWARIQPMSKRFYQRFNMASVAYLSEEMLNNGKSPEGFDLATLRADLAALPSSP